MNMLTPLAWILGLTFSISLIVWIAARMMRWAKKGSKGAALLGWGIGISAAGVNPQPPPQEKIEEVKRDIQGRKNSDAADPEE